MFLIGSANIMLFWLAIYLFALTFSLAAYLYLAITGIIAFLKKCGVEKKGENIVYPRQQQINSTYCQDRYYSDKVLNYR